MKYVTLTVIMFLACAVNAQERAKRAENDPAAKLRRLIDQPLPKLRKAAARLRASILVTLEFDGKIKALETREALYEQFRVEIVLAHRESLRALKAAQAALEAERERIRRTLSGQLQARALRSLEQAHGERLGELHAMVDDQAFKISATEASLAELRKQREALQKRRDAKHRRLVRQAPRRIPLLPESFKPDARKELRR